MRRRPASFLALLALVGGLLATNPVSSPAAAAPEPDRLDVYVGDLTPGQLSALIELGVDRQDLEISPDPRRAGHEGRVRVEAILSQEEAELPAATA